jgi:hypothetical protein
MLKLNQMVLHYLMFSKLDDLRLGSHVPNPDCFVVGKTSDSFRVGQKVASMRRVFMAVERSEKRFVADGEESNFSVVASDAHQLTVGPERSSVRRLAKFCQALVNVVGQRVENLNLESQSIFVIVNLLFGRQN